MDIDSECDRMECSVEESEMQHPVTCSSEPSPVVKPDFARDTREVAPSPRSKTRTEDPAFAAAPMKASHSSPKTAEAGPLAGLRLKACRLYDHVESVPEQAQLFSMLKWKVIELATDLGRLDGVYSIVALRLTHHHKSNQSRYRNWVKRLDFMHADPNAEKLHDFVGRPDFVGFIRFVRNMLVHMPELSGLESVVETCQTLCFDLQLPQICDRNVIRTVPDEDFFFYYVMHMFPELQDDVIHVCAEAEKFAGNPLLDLDKDGNTDLQRAIISGNLDRAGRLILAPNTRLDWKNLKGETASDLISSLLLGAACEGPRRRKLCDLKTEMQRRGGRTGCLS